MAHIVLGSIFTDGFPAAAGQLAAGVFAPAAPATSLAEKNGLLDGGNLTSKLTHRCFRLGAGALGGTVTSSAVWDYHRTEDDKVLQGRVHEPIPGAGIQFKPPWDCIGRFAWSIVFRSNLAYRLLVEVNDPDFDLAFMLNGAHQQPIFTVGPAYDNGVVPTAVLRKRQWNGHFGSDSALPASHFTANQSVTACVGVYAGYPLGWELYPWVHFRVFRATFSYLLLKK